MRQKRILSGTVEQQLAQADAMLVQMKRREVKHVVGIIPPIPIFSYSATPGENGEVFRFLSPLSGKIDRVAMMIETMPKGGVEFSITSSSEDEITTRLMSTKKPRGIYKSDIKVLAGDSIILTVKSEKEEEGPPRGIWLSILIQPLRFELETEKFLLDTLEEKIDEGV